MARSVCIETSADIDIAEYIDRLTDEELAAEVVKRSNVANGTGKVSPGVEGDGMGGNFEEAAGYCIPSEELEAIRDAIKTKGSDAAMVLVREMVCRELGCIL